MSDWIETYRGAVKAWECDVFAHFTIAYYFDRFADATRTYLSIVDAAAAFDAGLAGGPARRVATFQHELRAGASFHILTAVTGVDGGTLRLGHQVVDSASGKTVAWLAETLPMQAALPAGVRQRLEALAIDWPGPQIGALLAPKVGIGLLTARDRVKSKEIDEDGVLSLADQVHRYSAASGQAMTAAGLTGEYLQSQRRGFSTFELDFIQSSVARVGERMDVTTYVAHLGKSSLRFAHRMTGADGRQIGFLVQSGVHLDMELRRSTAIPDDLRASISKLLAGD